MMKRLFYAAICTLVYLFFFFFGNFVFGISERFSWTTTLWEALFFFIFIFLIQGFRNKK